MMLFFGILEMANAKQQRSKKLLCSKGREPVQVCAAAAAGGCRKPETEQNVENLGGIEPSMLPAFSCFANGWRYSFFFASLCYV